MTDPAGGATRAGRIVSARAVRIRVPLTSPYRWRGGTVEEFDSTLTVLVDDTGAIGVGEGTAVEGYSFETPDTVWTRVRAVLPTLPGRDAACLLADTTRATASAPFAMAAVRGALEALGHAPTPLDTGPVPVLGTVRASAELDEVASALALVATGHRVLKLKIGGDPADDLRRVDALRPVLGAASLRLDANQGYAPEQAAAFLRGLDPTGIELVEQPLAAGAWREQQDLARLSPVPLMLDEAIWSDDDVRRAARCAAIVKLKVMKSGGLDRALHQARVAHALGLGVVIGNGVATEVDAFAEALVARRAGLTRATELNGFTKQAVSPVLDPFVLRGGMLDLTTIRPPTLDEDVVDDLCVARVQHTRAAVPARSRGRP